MMRPDISFSKELLAGAGKVREQNRVKLILPLHLSPTDYSHKATLARAELHATAALLNPKGFRAPGRRGTSSAEKAAIAAGQVDGDSPEPSDRAKAKAKARRLHIETVKEQQRAGMESAEQRKRKRGRGWGR